MIKYNLSKMKVIFDEADFGAPYYKYAAGIKLLKIYIRVNVKSLVNKEQILNGTDPFCTNKL